MRSQFTYIYITTACTGHFFLGFEIGQLVNLKTGDYVVSGGGVTLGYYWYGCASQYLETNPNHIPGLFFKKKQKTQPIHILDNTES